MGSIKDYKSGIWCVYFKYINNISFINIYFETNIVYPFSIIIYIKTKISPFSMSSRDISNVRY